MRVSAPPNSFSAGPSQGIVNLKMEPWPACDSTQILPPQCSTIFLQMARPIPLPGILGPGVQALEDDKNFSAVLRRNADPVIAHAEQPLLARFLGLHGDHRRFFPAKLDRVSDQILEDLRHLRAVRPNRRQRPHA